MIYDLPPPPDLSELQRNGPVALFVDFDGTLIDLAAQPGMIKVPSGLSQKIGALASDLEGRFALVSGRSVRDLLRHLGPMAVFIAGSHGAELRDPDAVFIAEASDPFAAPNLATVRDFARTIDGLEIEEKPMGLALHYRGASAREAEVLAFAAQMLTGDSCDLKRGKFVVEFVPPGVNKGNAVDILMQNSIFKGTLPIFLGDDITDEDGFAAVIRHGGHALAVGDRPSRSAQYHLENPHAVREWLFATR